LVAGCTFKSLEQRHAWREQFESMRLLYVAATRAEDRLILSGTIKDLKKLGLKRDTWLNWIWQSLELPPPSASGVIDLDEGLQLQLTLNLAAQPDQVVSGGSVPQPESLETTSLTPAAHAETIAIAFPLLVPVKPDHENAVQRFSVTQLINYQRCPRQYYFDRVLHAPARDAMAVWNDAEAPEPPANLTATLKGAVIHRFCETYTSAQNAEQLLRRSFDEVVRIRPVAAGKELFIEQGV